MADRSDLIRVFLSYAQQTGDHPGQVRRLADSLRSAGILSIIDQYEAAPTQGWRAWMDEQIRDADWILVVCSRAYFERASRTAPAGQGRGAVYESSLILDELYAAGMTNTRFVPVVFERDDARFIPPPLQAYQRYLWDRDHENLLRHLTGQPKVVPPPVAPRVVVLEPEAPRDLGLGLGTVPADNPFTDIGAVREAARFVGRRRELDRLRSMLTSASVNVWGEPKIGKSSLLQRVASFWDGEVLGPFDCHGLLDAGELYAGLGAALGCAPDRRAVRDTLCEGRRLLVIDELDAAPSRGLGLADLQLLRSVANQNPDFHVLAASRLQIREIYPDDGLSGSPGFNLTLPLQLGPMDPFDAQDLLRPPWTPEAVFTPEQVDELLVDLARSGCEGRPFWIQRAAHHCFEALKSPAHPWKDAWRRERSALT